MRAVADPVDESGEPVEVDGFGQHIDRIQARGHPFARPSRQHNDRDAPDPRIASLPLEKPAPAHTGHQIVEQNQLGQIDPGEHLERVPTVPREVHLTAVPREELAQHRPHVVVVVDNQNALRHTAEGNVTTR